MGLFDGLESLGIKNTKLTGEDLYKSSEANQKKSEQLQSRKPDEHDPMDYLYAKEFECPVCNKTFTNYITRKSRLRLKEMDLDLKPNYHAINVNAYDVIHCSHCGYTALLSFFNRVTDKQRDLLIEKIKPFYKSKEYPVPLSLEDAAERYKMALFCALTVGANAGLKAILCLKTAWLYRDMKDKPNEVLFMQNARTGFLEAYKSENFPIGAMDELTVMFVIGELSRRTGALTDASKWISGVVVSKSVKKTLKERAMTSKDLIREGITS